MNNVELFGNRGKHKCYVEEQEIDRLKIEKEEIRANWLHTARNLRKKSELVKELKREINKLKRELKERK